MSSSSGSGMSSNVKVSSLTITKLTNNPPNDRRWVASWGAPSGDFASKTSHYLINIRFLYYGHEWEWIINTKEKKVTTLTETIQVPAEVGTIHVEVKPVSKTYTDKKKKTHYYYSSASWTGMQILTPLYTAPSAGAASISIRQSGSSGREVLAEWVWNRDNTSNYSYVFQYRTSNGGTWQAGTEGTASLKNATYTAPDIATAIRVRVKPNPEHDYDWTSDWSGWAEFSTSSFAPDVPSTPTVSISGNRLSAYVNTGNSTATSILFQILQDNNSVVASISATVNYSRAAITYTVAAGHTYRVRCIGKNSVKQSQYWSDWSDPIYGPPTAPTNLTVSSLSTSSVRLTWVGSSYADNYVVEYTFNEYYFDANPSDVQSQTINSGTTAIIANLDSNQQDSNTWWFRAKAVKDNSSSGWSNVVKIVLGRKPSPPTTWALTTVVAIGDPIKLYWIHNSRDNSSQTWARLKLIVNGTEEIINIENTRVGDERDETSEYDIDTTNYADGTEIKWQVQTRGMIDIYSDWSTLRTVKIFTPPSLGFNYPGSGFPETIDTLPVTVSLLADPPTQQALRYVLTIVSLQDYQGLRSDGTVRFIAANDPIYSQLIYSDSEVPNALDQVIGVKDITLENTVEYKLTCEVFMNTGLTASCSTEFVVEWNDDVPIPNADIGVDEENLAYHIRPYCLDDNLQEVTEHILLSVYRRNYDGSFTPITEDIEASEQLTVLDPHPPLIDAVYRLAAKLDYSGKTVFYDMSVPVEFNTSAIIIQWEEEWRSYKYTEYNVDSDDTIWTGTTLKLPYNVDVADNKSPDVELVEYIGREHPVSYYGTQIGETATWSTVIPIDDYESIFKLRRLARYMGDCYVREPAGVGFWANVTVSMSQKHMETTIPVTFTITRVEGGA